MGLGLLKRSTSSYSPAFFLLPPRHQSILISVGHVFVDLAFVRNIFLSHSFSSIRATWPAHFNLLYLIALTICRILLILCSISSSTALPHILYHIFCEGFSFQRHSIFFHHFCRSPGFCGPCVGNGFTSVLCIGICVFLDNDLLVQNMIYWQL